jgi:hypothetical protein
MSLVSKRTSSIVLKTSTKRYIHTRRYSRATARCWRWSPKEESSFRHVVCVYGVLYVFLRRWKKSFYLLLMCYKLIHCIEIPWCDMSVRMEKLRPHRKEFHEIWYLSIFREDSSFIKKIKLNNGWFTWRSIYVYDISLNYSWNVKCFRQKL